MLANQQALVLVRSLDSGADPGFLQVRFSLTGPLDVARYEAAWREVVDWHPALRSSVRERDDGNPLAVVWRHVDLQLEAHDWRSENASSREQHVQELLDADRVEGIDLGIAPAMRLNLIRTGDRTYEVVWTCHHLFVDGWSAAIVLAPG